MALAIVNKNGFGNAAATNPLTSGTFSSTTGNLLVCAVRAGGSTTVTSVKNQAGVAFTALAAQVNGAQTVQFFYLKNITGNASDTVVVTFSGAGNSNNCAYFWEISGADIFNPIDANTGGNASSGSSVTSAAFSTVIKNEIILSCAVANASGTFSAGSGYALDSANGFGGFIGAQHLITSSTQSAVTASMTTTASAPLLGISIASFVAAGQRLTFSQAKVQTNTSPPGSLTISYTTTPKAGSLLLCTVATPNSTGFTFTVADNVNGAWTPVGSNTLIGAVGSGQAFYFPGGAGGATTVTVTIHGTGTPTTVNTVIAEYFGQAVSSPLDTSAYAQGVTTPGPFAASLTTSFTNEEIIEMVVSNTAANWTINGATWTQRAGGGALWVMADSPQQSAGSATGSVTADRNTITLNAVMAFKSLGSASLVTNTNSLMLLGAGT